MFVCNLSQYVQEKKRIKSNNNKKEKLFFPLHLCSIFLIFQRKNPRKRKGEKKN